MAHIKGLLIFQTIVSNPIYFIGIFSFKSVVGTQKKTSIPKIVAQSDYFVDSILQIFRNFQPKRIGTGAIRRISNEKNKNKNGTDFGFESFLQNFHIPNTLVPIVSDAGLHHHVSTTWDSRNFWDLVFLKDLANGYLFYAHRIVEHATEWYETTMDRTDSVSFVSACASSARTITTIYLLLYFSSSLKRL